MTDPAATQGKFDVSQPPAGHSVSGDFKLNPIEHDAERKVRLFKDVVQYLVFMLLFVGSVGLCFYGVLAPGVDPAQKDWAARGLFTAIGGVVGYLMKK